MQEYRIFLSEDSGAFGGLRRIFFVSDDAAVAACTRLLNDFSGVDIWQEDRRVALLTREAFLSAAQGPKQDRSTAVS